MKKIVWVLLFITFVITSCKKEGEIIDITGNCIFYDNILGTCFYGTNGLEYDEIVFRDNEAYQKFGNSVRIYPANVDCDTAKLPEIDFSKFSLLAKRTHGGGCSANYIRKIFKDTENKKMIYQISANYEGDCYMLLSSRNWAYVPKIPDNYKVEFQIN